MSTPGPISVLEREHRFIAGVAAALPFLEASPRMLPDVVGFLREYADACHHGKEEVLFFAALEAEGLPPAGCPLGVLRNDHDEARGLVRRLSAADAADLRYLLGALRELYLNHIVKEDYILQPLAARLLPADAMAELEQRFEAADQRFGLERRDRWERFATELIRRFHTEGMAADELDHRRRHISELARTCHLEGPIPPQLPLPPST